MKKVIIYLLSAKYRKYWIYGLSPIVIFFILHFTFPINTYVPYSQLIISKEGKVLNVFLSKDEKWRMKTELAEITPELEKAFIEKEDRYFYYHLGINPLAIARAIFNNVTKAKKTSGASTITMQVARLLAPKERTYLNKIVEMFRAVQLEVMFSKKEILALYLNLVPYGGNVEGIKSASLLYFDRLPDKLSLAQITTLAIIPNRPTSLALGKHNERIGKERNKWLNRFKENKAFDDQQIEDAISEPIAAKRLDAPALAPHFANYLHQQIPTIDIVKTTIRADVQSKVEDITYSYSRKLVGFNIHNAAVVVVDNKTRNIIAYLGSPDFADIQHAGQVDNARSYRSPGSALKPLIYGLAFDEGIVTPKSVVNDLPVDFSGYAPENYNRTFNGAVSIEVALANSLNVPAVKMLDQIGVKNMLQALRKAQFQEIIGKDKKLGLSVALGGCGVSLVEMAGLYCAFANQGTFQELKMLDNELLVGTQTTASLISPSAAYMLTEVLTKVERPEMPSDYEHNPHIPKIAWKTGTSYGRRDAWSIGYNAKYTVAVWLGNANGVGSPELVGAGVATPLLFKLFNVIDYNAPLDWFFMPDELRTRLVCTASGDLPSDFCESTTSDYFMPTISHTRRCQHLRYVFVSPDEKMSYCSECLPENGFKKKLYPNHSPEMLAFYESNQMNIIKMPIHNPQCTKFLEGNAPKIVSPIDGREYLTIDEEPIELMLNCNVDNDVKKVFWYINNKFYKAVKPNEKVFFSPESGEVKISCSDDKGRNTDIKIWVK
ncbi:MAG: penicillin-binding protein 1C [Cytophagales bacterium]|nr:MAG: penicillin-binding protein 1C [Cytophagales bacterium]